MLKNKTGVAATSCSQCLYDTDHPFGLVVDDSGVCSGCRVHQEKTADGWEERLEEFASLLKRRAQFSTSRYDCLVPIKATPEYFYLLKLLVQDFGLSVLAVYFNGQLNSEVGVRNLARMIEVFDLDVEEFIVNPRDYKAMLKHSLFSFGSLRWPLISGEASFAFSVASRQGISSVVWPFSDAIEQVGAHSYSEKASFSEASWVGFDLFGASPSTFFSSSASLRDVCRPNFEVFLDPEGPIGIYAANFIPWDSRLYAEFACENLGALSSAVPRTFDTYDRVDDVAYMRIHDLLKKAKLGYGRVRDHLVREIRFGRLERRLALELENLYSEVSISDVDLEPFASWLGSSVEGLRWLERRWGAGFFGGELNENRHHSIPVLSDDASRFVEKYVNNSSTTLSVEPILIRKGLYLWEAL